MYKYIISVKPISETHFHKEMIINPKTNHYDKYTVTKLDIHAFFKQELEYENDSTKELVALLDEKLLNVTKYKFTIHNDGQNDGVYVITKNERIAQKFVSKLRSLKEMRGMLLGRLELFKNIHPNQFLLKTLLLKPETLDLAELISRMQKAAKDMDERV